MLSVLAFQVKDLCNIIFLFLQKGLILTDVIQNLKPMGGFIKDEYCS
jgi:hypothetical protein